MSWKTSGKLLSGPPTSSNTNKLDPRFRPNLGGLNAYQREQQLVGRYGGREAAPEVRRSEWDVLKENHRFIRDDEEPGEVSWEERLARAYESKLFKEFALIDLKHFKSRRLALRWRTAEEVVDGIGEDTCASLRCRHHRPTAPSPRRNEAMWEDASTPGPSVSERGYDRSEKRSKRSRMPALRAFELPFVYEEAGERKEALVKVKLCSKCQAKLTWKPGKEGPDSGDGSEAESDKPEKGAGRRVDRNDREDSRRHRRSRRDDGTDDARNDHEGRRGCRADRHHGRQSDNDDYSKDRRPDRRDRNALGDRGPEEDRGEPFRPRPLRKGSQHHIVSDPRSPGPQDGSASPTRSRSPPPRRRHLM